MWNYCRNIGNLSFIGTTERDKLIGSMIGRLSASHFFKYRSASETRRENGNESVETVKHLKGIVLRKHVEVGRLKHHVFIYKYFPWLKDKELLHAFCSGNIISKRKVLTSAHCFLTNRKRLTRNMKLVKVAAGTTEVTTKMSDVKNPNAQWRIIDRIHSQKFYRFPSYSLAVLIMDREWVFNEHINSIPYASLDQDFDGICSATAIRTLTSWSANKVLFDEPMQILSRADCEVTLQRTCRIFYCTAYDKENALAAFETEGGGLICRGTNDPQEVDARGVLVGVTTLINTYLPTLHNRVAIFRTWIENCAPSVQLHNTLLVVSVIALL